MVDAGACCPAWLVGASRGAGIRIQKVVPIEERIQVGQGINCALSSLLGLLALRVTLFALVRSLVVVMLHILQSVNHNEANAFV